MDKVGSELLSEAKCASSGRAVRAIKTGGRAGLRHMMVALCAGAKLSDHNNPGEATLLVLRGSVCLRDVENSTDWEGMAGDLVEIPQARHGVVAREDSVVVLTLVKL